MADAPDPLGDDVLAASRAAFVAGLASGDVARACAVYSEAARLLAPSAELVEGRDAIERFWKAGLESGIAGVDLEARELAHGAGLAWELGRYTFWLTDTTGLKAAERGAYVLVHERQADGSWQRTVEMFNPETRD